MGKKRRRMNSPKYARKFAAKYAKFKAAVAEAISTTAGIHEEIIEEREKVEEVPKVIIKEVDESVTAEPKPKAQPSKFSPLKKTPDSKKRPAKKKTSKRKTSKKD
jgi:hypothetical protein